MIGHDRRIYVDDSGEYMTANARLCRPVQIRFPRSKKKRIRRKWAKDPKNYCSLFQYMEALRGVAIAAKTMSGRIELFAVQAESTRQSIRKMFGDFKGGTS